MLTTEQEKRNIEKAINMRAAKRRKWAYLLYNMIEEKIKQHRSYDDLAKWLSQEGLLISENALKQLMWSYRKKVNLGKSENKEAPLLSAIPKNIPSVASSELNSQPETQPRNLNDELRERTQQLKNKNTGFDAFDDL